MAQGVFPAGDLTNALGGLFSVADVTRHAEANTRWAQGPYSWDSLACPMTTDLTDFCSNEARGTIIDSSGGSRCSWPFGIISLHECYSVGISVAERRRIVVEQNELTTQKAVEAELWGGQLAQATNRLDVPYLNNGNAVDVTGAGGPVPVDVGIAKLEQGLADCGLGTLGVIHLTRQAAQLAASKNAIEMDGNGVLHTALGTPVAAGVGYDPDLNPAAPAHAPVPAPKPLGPRSNDQWGFATGPVHVHLGPSEYIGERDQEFSIGENKIVVIAGRPAAVYWDSCCTIEVHMDVTP